MSTELSDTQQDLVRRCHTQFDELQRMNDGYGVVLLLSDPASKDYTCVSNLPAGDKIKVLANQINVIMEMLDPTKVEPNQGAGI